MSDWNFFTNHGHIIFLIGINPDQTLRDLSTQVGITERSAQKIITDLVNEGFIRVTKEGRNNHYRINGKKKLRHPIEKNCKIEDLIELIKTNQ